MQSTLEGEHASSHSAGHQRNRNTSIQGARQGRLGMETTQGLHEEALSLRQQFCESLNAVCWPCLP